MSITAEKEDRARAAPEVTDPGCIEIIGARTHNLQNIRLEIPHEQITVITGVSGSGKSSLAIDTLFAEGQRQYIESLSTYARQFLDQLVRPDVDAIHGLEPTLCIDQKSGTTSPRSTVATVTEIYDYLRLLMARAGTAHCYECGQPIVQQPREQIVREVMALPEGTRIVVLSPIVRGRRGAHREALETIRKAGLVRVRVDGTLYELDEVPSLAVRREHTIEAIVDKIVLRPGCEERLARSLDTALDMAEGVVAISFLTPAARESVGDDRWEDRLFSTRYACARCGISYEEIEPRTFSFNSPYGACPSCEGTGVRLQFNPASLVDWDRPPGRGGFVFLTDLPAGQRRQLTRHLKKLVESCGGQWSQPLRAMPVKARRELMGQAGATSGLLGLLEKTLAQDEASEDESSPLEEYLEHLPCPTCAGARLRSEALAVRLAGKNIYEICSLSVADAIQWFQHLDLSDYQREIATPILQAVQHRLTFLQHVGVGYLSLTRSTRSLSGGELQRVRLASSIGSGLVGVCYILDEPSIGLHPVDHQRLIGSLRALQEQGNTVVVVEHDQAMMEAADVLVDVGPGAGRDGGQVIAVGPPAEVRQHPTSLTARYLRDELRVQRTTDRRAPVEGASLTLHGASLHNLKDVTLELPLGLLIGVTGVSGSGKSSLIGQTLIPALKSHLGGHRRPGGPYRKLAGAERLDKAIEVTQAAIGRTPRSTPATYVGVFDLIRQVFARTREAKSRGFTASRFSFNTGQGRCEQCLGQGQEKIEMNFLPDIYVPCAACGGRRFNRTTLQVRYRDKSIADCLEMSVDEASDFFCNFDKILRLLHAMQQVGLGYLTLGQPSSTLSGGEAQRIKLATELARRDTGRTIYFFDEPTTGLHMDDVQRLILVLDALVERGNTVVVIEHNLDVIRNCDWLIDLGPGGGDAGGEIVATGPPESLRKAPDSITGKYI
ncbi:MAG: excinuclease ABC subunit UvrA [Planctomycetota bacterium]|nr:MAG: excinuclease ABC subunit UvrA [Planctomycetota bacterium]